MRAKSGLNFQATVNIYLRRHLHELSTHERTRICKENGKRVCCKLKWNHLLLISTKNTDFPAETVEKMAKVRTIRRIHSRQKYGGAGGDHISYAITVEELSRVCASTGVICSAHTSLCCMANL